MNFGVKARRAPSDGVKPIGLLRIGLALDLMLTSKGYLDQPLHQSLRRFTHDGRT